MVPYNLMKEGGKAAYLILEHGQAALLKKLFLEKLLSLLHLKKKITITSQRLYVPADADYFHCSNNTIFGTQIKTSNFRHACCM
jgi:phosphoserine aminotransferase